MLRRMSRGRLLFSSLGVVASCLLAAPTADALAPCDEVCHLSQGTPVLLEDTKQLWVRRCVRPENDARCVVRRTKLDGTVLEERPAPHLFDRAFRDAKLKGHTVRKVAFKGAWNDLGQPFLLGLLDDRVGTTLRLDGDTLILASKGAGEIRRKLPCKPTTVEVRATGAAGFGVVVATARCESGTPSRGPEDIVAVFQTVAGRVD